MLLSIALLTKNSEDTVRYALRSIYRQVIPRDIEFELVVVDGYSKDSTLKIVAEEVQRLRERFQSQFVRHAVLQERVGVGFARNLALRESQGDWILWLDSDNILAQDYIVKAVKRISEVDERVAVLFPRKVVPVYKKRNLASRLILCYSLSLAQLRESVSKLERMVMEQAKGSVQKALPYTATQGTVCNADALRKVGGFNSYLIAAEDIDVFLKLTRNGYRMRSFNSTLYHFMRESLTAWFKHAMVWSYGGAIMESFINDEPPKADLHVAKRIFANIETFIKTSLSLIVSAGISMEKAAHVCGPLVALLMPLIYVFRRAGYINGTLHALRLTSKASFKFRKTYIQMHS